MSKSKIFRSKPDVVARKFQEMCNKHEWFWKSRSEMHEVLNVFRVATAAECERIKKILRGVAGDDEMLLGPSTLKVILGLVHEREK